MPNSTPSTNSRPINSEMVGTSGMSGVRHTMGSLSAAVVRSWPLPFLFDDAQVLPQTSRATSTTSESFFH